MINWIKKYNIFYWFISLLTAVSLWAYVTVVLDPLAEITVDGIELEFLNSDRYLDARSLAVVDGWTQTVSITYEGRRLDLYKINRDDLKAVIDFSRELPYAGVRAYSYEITGLPLTSSVQAKRHVPTGITLEVDAVDERDIDIKLQNENTVAAEGYKMEPHLFEPEKIRVKGPVSILNSIEAAVVYYEGYELERTVSHRSSFSFVDSEGEVIDPVRASLLEYDNEVLLTISVSYTKTVPLELSFNPGGGISRDNIDYIFHYNEKETGNMKEIGSILISGEAETLKNIERIDLGVVDLTSLTGDETRIYPIVLDEGVTNETGISEIEAEIKIHGAVTRTLSVGQRNISLKATPPAGHKIEIVTREMDITIRGEEKAVAKVAPEDIQVTLDLSSETLVPGTRTDPAEISIRKLPNGIVSKEYTVTISVVPL
ncbi:MAG: hypothetical protein FWH04_05155 [Oscillospiraceae bacterium]|nr:hypothetical protein [Oscillospiraceae bacterium]